jgi:hypothetical protein
MTVPAQRREARLQTVPTRRQAEGRGNPQCGTVVYENAFPVDFAPTGANGRVADDCEMISPGGDVCSISGRIWNDHSSDATIFLELWDGCPISGGGATLLSTSPAFSVAPEYSFVIWSLEPYVTAPAVVWVAWRSAHANVGPLVSEEAEIGYTANNFYASDCGGGESCNCGWSGNPYAGLDVTIRVEAPANVIDKATHPGLGDCGRYTNLFLANDQYTDYGSAPAEVDTVVFCGSHDYGATWGDITWLVDRNTLEPRPYSMASAAYWGENNGLDRWYVTLRDDTATSHINLLQWDTDDDSLVNIWEASLQGQYWNYSSHGCSDLKQPQIACDNRFASWWWGVMSFSIDKSGASPPNDRPALFYQEDETGLGTMRQFNRGDALGNDVAIDPVGDHFAAAWDPIYSSYGHSLLALWQNINDPNDYESFVWFHTGEVSHPAVAVHDGAIICAAELNLPSSHPYKMLLLLRFEDDTVGGIAQEWYCWYGYGPLVHPEIKHVFGDTFVVGFAAENASDPEDRRLAFIATRDAGMTWTDWEDIYWLGGTDAVSEYRAIEMSSGGNNAIWEYRPLPASNDLVYLHLETLAVEMNGHVYYADGSPAAPTQIVVENLDPEHGGIIPMEAIIDGNSYHLKLMVSWDVWIGATLRVTASQPGETGSAQHVFESIDPVNTIDVTYTGLPAGACCFGDGHCEQLTETGCTSAGGVSWTMDLPCEPNPCPLPGCPTEPRPEDGATNVLLDTDLDWADAQYATSYDVCFGDTSPPPFAGNTPTSDWPLPTLNYDTVYYWQVVAKNSAGSTLGPVWSFQTVASAPSGPIVAWGMNDYGQCNVPSPNESFVAVAAGGYHSLGLKVDGSIAAWGRNQAGQCDVPAPNSGFVEVTAGSAHTLGLKGDGSILAWGWNNYGQCNVPAPNDDFTGAAAGVYHSLGCKADGSIAAWGYNYYGQCNVPAPNANFVAVAAGDWHSLGLKADGAIVAWGWNNHGQCSVPAPNADFVAVEGGAYHSLGLKANGTIVPWGRNNYGQCNVPVPNSDFIAIGAGDYFSLGLKADGTIVAWGANDYGQCNVPSPNADFVAVASGNCHGLAIQSSPAVTGACCLPGSQCEVLSPDECATLQGNYKGEGTTCEPNPCLCAGDLNCDGVVDFGDINPFVLILSSPAAWQQAYPGCPPLNGDINGNLSVGFEDINPFVALMVQSPMECQY